MELQLEEFIDSSIIVTDINNISEDIPMLLKTQHEETGDMYIVVISKVEPTEMVLPLNAVWVDLDPNSINYKHALRRQSKDKDSVYSYEHTWEVLYFYDDLWIQAEYDPDDLINIPDPQDVTPATVAGIGVGRLTTPEEDSLVIGEGDETLGNSRVPLPHDEMHEEVPASMIAMNQTDDVFASVVDQGDPELGMTLISRDSGNWFWDTIEEDDLLENL